jgi:two-component system chemotaxis sensor kinase CheA
MSITSLVTARWSSEKPMSDNRDKLIEQIDDLLNRLACGQVVMAPDGDPAEFRRGLDTLAALISELGAPSLEALARELCRQASTDGPSTSLEALSSAWTSWRDATPAPALPGQAAAAPAAAEDDELAVLASDPELGTMFIAEALDHLGTIESVVLQLETYPDDATLLNDVFRPFHTIKGNARALGVSSVGEFAHKVENLLDRCRSGKHRVGSEEIEVILKSVDLLTAMIEDLRARLAGQPRAELRAEQDRLTAAVEYLVVHGAAAVVAPPAPPPASEPDGLDLTALDAPTVPEAVAPRPAPPEAAAPPPEPRRRADDSNPASVKVDTRKLDNLVDMVGELVIVQSLIQEDPALLKAIDERLGRKLAQFKRITTDLQRSAMSVRLMPIKQTFQKMARLVRDLSRHAGKRVELSLAGEETELDRKVIEEINDPLMHMVRNSIDHGIEDAETRRRQGKSPEGHLTLSASYQGSEIVIAISDDGMGLNTDRIAAKALAQGLIAPGAALSPSDIHHLIFAPGFSTAEKITEISGRGVGMDVVRRNIEALRGHVEISTETGRGTTFRIKLPVTLAILDGVLVGAGSERFVLPTFAIRESLRPTPDQLHTVQGRATMIRMRDRMLPMARLADLFDVPHATSDPSKGTVVVIEDGARQVGLLVDEVLGKQEVVIKSLGATFTGVKGVAGGAILGDGRVGLILDAGGLIKLMNGLSSLAA